MTGIILIDKPENITSFSAVNRVRRILGVKKAGHTGTLDPMATGVLPVALSNSTRFISLLPVHDKEYLASARLGITTDTLDITGRVLSEKEVNISKEQLLRAAEGFTGEISQLPPMYSAVKKDGKRLYELARQGVEVEREARRAVIYDLSVTDFDGRDFTFRVSCSAGTYVRSLCDDIGRALGCGAVMTGLRRTSANGFTADECVTLEQLQEAAANGEAEKFIKPIDSCFSAYKEITVTDAQAVRFRNGGALSLDRLSRPCPVGFYRVYSPKGAFLGIGKAENGDDFLSVGRVFVDE